MIRAPSQSSNLEPTFELSRSRGPRGARRESSTVETARVAALEHTLSYGARGSLDDGHAWFQHCYPSGGKSFLLVGMRPIIDKWCGAPGMVLALVSANRAEWGGGGHTALIV